MQFSTKRKKFFLEVVFSLLFISYTLPQTRWISFGGAKAPEKVSFHVMQCDEQSMLIDLSIPGVVYERLNTREGEYAILTLVDYGYTTEIGKPQLPVIREFVEIPREANFDVEVMNLSTREVDLAELGIDAKIVPVQPPVPKIPDAKVAFEMDKEFYERDSYCFTDVFRLHEVGLMREHRLIQIEIFPVDYNPKAGKLKFCSEMQLKINLTGSNFEDMRIRSRKYQSRAFEKILKNIVINYGSYENGVLGKSTEGDVLSIGFLIITHDSFYDKIQPFVSWLTRKKYRTTVVKLSGLLDQSNNGVRDFIRYAYNNWSPPPSYVLLVGDTDYLPTFTGDESGTATDLYYSCMDDADYLPDIGVSRFSVVDVPQTEAVTEKKY